MILQKIARNTKCTLVIIGIFIVALLPTTSNAQKVENSGSVLLLIDCSGSMMGARMDSVKSAAKQIIGMLLPCNTEFAVMGFTGDKDNPVTYRLDFTRNKAELYAFIDKLHPWGGTRLGAALKVSSLYFTQHAKTAKSKKQTIIILSDGRSDDNVSATLKELKERKSLIQCECIGYVIENDKLAQDQLLQITRETGGEYFVASGVTNVIKAFQKTSIKTIIHEVPVVVRKPNKNLNFKAIPADIYKLLTTQNWLLDSIQINVSDSLYEFTQFMVEENMQDTLPKSLVFDSNKKVSLFIDKGMAGDVNKKWIEGDFVFAKNALTIIIRNYYFKFMVKSINKQSLVLCVNKFMYITGGDAHEPSDIVCDCSNKITNDNPYILVYFSKAGCN